MRYPHLVAQMLYASTTRRPNHISWPFVSERDISEMLYASTTRHSYLVSWPFFAEVDISDPFCASNTPGPHRLAQPLVVKCKIACTLCFATASSLSHYMSLCYRRRYSTYSGASRTCCPHRLTWLFATESSFSHLFPSPLPALLQVPISEWTGCHQQRSVIDRFAGANLGNVLPAPRTS
jgi:hypothetical protein